MEMYDTIGSGHTDFMKNVIITASYIMITEITKKNKYPAAHSYREFIFLSVFSGFHRIYCLGR